MCLARSKTATGGWKTNPSELSECTGAEEIVWLGVCAPRRQTVPECASKGISDRPAFISLTPCPALSTALPRPSYITYHIYFYAFSTRFFPQQFTKTTHTHSLVGYPHLTEVDSCQGFPKHTVRVKERERVKMGLK